MELQTQFDKDSFMDAYESHAKNMPQVEMQTENVLFGGIYTRRIIIPKGCLITGATHKIDSIAIQIYGDINILNDDGSESRLTGYTAICSKAGTRRMGYAHEESMWVGIYPTNAEDIDSAMIEIIDTEKTDMSKFIGFNDIKMKELLW